jgi:hypothetical protein
MNKGVGRQEALRRPRRPEPLHLPFSPSGRSMRVLGPIVQTAALTVFDFRQQRALRHAIAAEFVGGDDARNILQTLQQPLEDTLRRPGIAAALHQDIGHGAILIDGAPETVQLALDPDKHLIEVPLVTRLGPRQRSLLAKLAPNVRHHHPAILAQAAPASQTR